MLVTDQHVTDSLLGRPLQEALGLNTRDLLVAAADRFVCCVETEKVLNSADTRGESRVSHVIKGVYHVDNEETVEDTTFEEEELCGIGNWAA